MFLPMYIWNKMFLYHHMTLGFISVPLLSLFQQGVSKCFPASVLYICNSDKSQLYLLYWFRLETLWSIFFFCKNLLLRFLFTCGSTFHLCGGVGLVCMNGVTDRPLLLATIICCVTTSKTGLALREITVIQLLTFFANHYVHKKSTQLSVHHLMQHVLTCKMSSSSSSSSSC